MAVSLTKRRMPFMSGTLEDLAVQYVPNVRQLLVTFYYNGFQFALICIKDNGELLPVKIVNNLKKDNNDLRCQLTLTILNDHYKEIFHLISEANPSFRKAAEKEFY